MNGKFIVMGIVFAFLWSSAATATKLALQTAQPFTISIIRFLLAGCVMIAVANLLLKKRLPVGKEWKQLAIYGALNVSIYLGIYIVAMQYLGAGIGSLAIAINPLFISLLSALFFGYRFTIWSVASLVICSGGVVLAAWPLLQNSYATPLGMLLLLVSMLTYSVAAIYYTRQKWNGLDILTINGWQTLFGGLLLVPIALITYVPVRNVFGMSFWVGTLWLALPVSIGAVLSWLYLLKQDTVRAAYWLYLCPVFGFFLAWLILKEPVTAYTYIGVLLVVGGLYLSQTKKEVS